MPASKLFILLGLLLVTTSLSRPLDSSVHEALKDLAQRLDLPADGKVCLTLGSTGTRTDGACGPIDTKELPGVALPKRIFDPHTPLSFGVLNPNMNALCGSQVQLTNGDNGITITAIVTDRNEEPPADQRCSDEEGEYGPYSVDIDPAGWASLGGTQERNDVEPDNPGDLAVLSYTFLGQRYHRLAH